MAEPKYKRVLIKLSGEAEDVDVYYLNPKKLNNKLIHEYNPKILKIIRNRFLISIRLLHG